MVAIENDEPYLASTSVQIIWGKQKRAISSSVTISFDQKHPSVLNSLEEHRVFFGQCRPFLDPTIHHHEVFSTTTPEKPSKFGQDLKWPDRVNLIKGEFAQYDKHSSFGILTDTFTCAKLPSTTHVLQYVLYPNTNKISDNIYQYHPRYCTNGESQVKYIDSDHSDSPVLESHTIRLIVAIYATYHLTIDVKDISNAFQNTLKDSSEREIIDCPPHYIY